MQQRRLGVIVALGLSLVWLTVGNVHAEPYVAAYGGISLASDKDFSLDFLVLQTGDLFTSQTSPTELDNSAIFGGKIGYWLDVFPFVGLELDLYTFRPDFHVSDGPFDFDVSIVTIGFNFLGRYPLLKSPDFPRGRIQPYIGIGPGLFITTIDDQQPDPTLNIGSQTLSIGGLQALAGAKFFIFKNLSLFAEWKFTHHTSAISGLGVDVPGNVFNFAFTGTQEFNVNHFYGGLAYHFY
jgi:Outer membrane protein beta-barrel domain